MAKIHLIGTIHQDIDGVKRLQNALSVEKPDILTLEACQEGLDHLTKMWQENMTYCKEQISRQGLENVAKLLLGEYLDSPHPYEVTVCQDYASQNGIELHLVDSPKGLNNVRALNEEVISFINNLDVDRLKHLTKESLIRDQTQLYITIQKLYDGMLPISWGEINIINPLEKTIMKDRDETEAKNILNIAESNPDAKIVHVGGAAHNIDDSRNRTLYSKLKELQPTRATLLNYLL